MGKSAEVPATYEGFEAEAKQAFFELLNHLDSKTIVAVEDKEDISISCGERLELIQVKSATSKKTQPLSDSYPDFWKTVGHWIDKTKKYNKYQIMNYKYSVSSLHCLTIGSYIQRINDVNSLEEAEQVYTDLKIDSDIKRIAERNTSNIFDEANYEIVLDIFVNFSFEIHRNFIEEIKGIFYQSGEHHRQISSFIFDEMYGWLSEEITIATQNGSPAKISRQKFQNQRRGIVARFKEDPLSAVAPDLLEPEEIKAEKSSTPLYLKQLDLIGLNDEQNKNEAIIDYLHAKRATIVWAKSLEVIKQSFASYNEELGRINSDIRREISIKDEADEFKGRETYFETRKEAARVNLQGKQVPRKYSCGILHDLAQSPANCPIVGWHPKYIELLSEDKEQNGGRVE